MRRPGTISLTPPPPKRRGRTVELALLWLLASGCAEESAEKSASAVTARKQASEAKPSAAVPAPPKAPSIEHVVEEGQTLWDIARAYGMPVQKVMEENRLRPRDIRRLSKGAKLTIPGAAQPIDVPTAQERAQARKQRLESLPKLKDGAYHVLGAGETVWDLARTYDKPMDDIVARNEFSDEDVRSLRPGDPVIIPRIKPGEVKQTAPEKRPGIVHVMEAGETIWDLAHAFQASAGEIMAANALSAQQVTSLREGTRLFIPGVTKDKKGRVRREMSPRQRRASRLAQRLGLGTRQAAKQLLRGRVSQRWIRAAGGSRHRLPGTLRWPVTKGWYTRGYGSGAGGYHQAVDIMGNVGWNVRAAAPGIVGYSGNGIRGYGNVVLVVHPGGWVTMYAHNSVNFVVAGERVPRGGILAEVGSTGISRGPHVHFELIHNGRNCDPASLFRPQVKFRSSRRKGPERAVWRDPERQPRAVSCGRRRRHPKSRWVIHENPEAGDS